jgi:DNA-binding MarR family transcriptional regulator
MNAEPTLSQLTDPLENRLGYQLRRASAVMMADLGQSLAPLELRPVEATILTLIGANPGCTQSDIGRSLGINRANMVPLMSRLLKKGMIEKAPVDGRSQALTLSHAGQAKVDAAKAIIDEHEARFQMHLNKANRNILIATLHSIRAS